MVKKIAITGLFLLTGCTPEHLAIVKEIAIVAASFRPQKPAESATPTPAPTSTLTATPSQSPSPLASPTASPEALPSPIPCGRKDPQDGAKRGFTWKPNSDTQKWAVAVLPEGIPGDQCTFAGLSARNKGFIGGAHEGTEKRAVTILDGWTGERLKKEHGAIRVRCGCYWWSIPNPAVRVD